MFYRVEIFSNVEYEVFVTFNFTNNILCLLKTLLGFSNFTTTSVMLYLTCECVFFFF